MEINILTEICRLFLFVVLCVCQFGQWFWVLINLYDGSKFVTKKDFLLQMLPGYFIIIYIRVAWNTFEKFMMLE